MYLASIPSYDYSTDNNGNKDSQFEHIKMRANTPEELTNFFQGLGH